MPDTLTELESFSQFAAQHLRQGDPLPTLEECLRQWRAECELQETVSGVQKSLDDVAQGRVKPVDQAFEDVRRRLGW